MTLNINKSSSIKDQVAKQLNDKTVKAVKEEMPEEMPEAKQQAKPEAK